MQKSSPFSCQRSFERINLRFTPLITAKATIFQTWYAKVISFIDCNSKLKQQTHTLTINVSFWNEKVEKIFISALSRSLFNMCVCVCVCVCYRRSWLSAFFARPLVTWRKLLARKKKLSQTFLSLLHTNTHTHIHIHTLIHSHTHKHTHSRLISPHTCI